MKKHYSLIALYISSLFTATIESAELSHSPAEAELLTYPLVQIANMRYQGAFVLDARTFGSSSLHDAEGGMAYAPPKPTAPNGSIFATGNYVKGGISEWAIPQIVNSEDVNELNMSEEPLQEFSDVKERAQKRRVKMGYFADLLWLDNQLLYSEHNYYPASKTNSHKMGVLRDADDLNSSEAAGYFSINALSGEEKPKSYTAKASSGWMSEIPAQWQSALAGTHLFGPADGWNIEGRFAAGPSVFSFNPEKDVLSTTPKAVVDSNALVDYSTEYPMTEIGIVGGNYINAPSDLWNSMSFVHFGLIPADSRTLMLVGNQWGLDGDIGYKITQNTGELCGGPCPFNSSDLSNYYWLIDLKDVVSARNGNRRYDSITPYAYGPLPLPFQKNREGLDTTNRLRGGAYESTTDTLYLQIRAGDPRPEYDKRPVMAVFNFDTTVDYPVPKKPIWNKIAGKIPRSNRAPTFSVQCTSCKNKSIEVSWNLPTESSGEQQPHIDHYRLHYENVNLGYKNTKRNQRIGVTVPGNVTKHVQTLSPGNWRVTIRAISSDGVPSET